MQQQVYGFPKLNNPVKIITKLNNMALTISDGWHDTKAQSVIIDQSIDADKQRFKITQKDTSKIYYIEPLYKAYLLSTRSGWSDMVYSQVKIEKYTQETNQLWRIVPYHHVVYTEKTQQQKVEYKPMMQVNSAIKVTSVGPKQDLGLGYGYEPHNIKQVKVQQKSGQVTTSIYKLGYQFESGPHVQTSTQVKSTSMTNDAIKASEPIEQQFDIANPPRFPIKQKNNLQPIDLNNEGWFFIENVKFNLVLEVEGGIDEPGMSIVLNRLNGNRNQLWRFQ